MDCDGTLVDSQAAICAIMEECFTLHGIAPPEPARVRRIVGLRLDDAMARLIEGPCPVSPQELADTYRVASARIRSLGTFAEPLYPGAREAMLGLSTAGCVLGYLCVLGIAKWPDRFGITKLPGETTADLRVPRYYQMIVLLAIVLAGVMLGQIVRRVRRLAEEFAQRNQEVRSVV